MISSLLDTFQTQAAYLTWQEWCSTICQIISVWFARKNHIWVYPSGIIGVLLATYVYLMTAQPPLYADGILNLYYFCMSIYGWVMWSKRKDDLKLKFPISHCQKSDWIRGLLLFITSFGAVYTLLRSWTNSDVPFLDALVASSAIGAMYWMARRKIENWLAWIFSNIVAIPLNYYKGFYLFTLMYVVFLLLAWMGYQSWKKIITPNYKTSFDNPNID
jgi:nicotinamide mononucleotide transporter